MKRGSSRHQLRLITEISVTPLLNLALMLVLVVLIAVPLLKKAASPAAPGHGTSFREAPPNDVATLSVDARQTLMLENATVARAELPAALKKLREARPEAAVLVRMHRDLPVQSLVEVMDELANAGVRKTTVVTSQAGSP